MADKVVYKAQFPLFSLLGIAFIVLKLCGVIAWSWWWVLAPFWIPGVIVLSILILVWAFGVFK